MKRIPFLVASILLVGNVAKASEEIEIFGEAKRNSFNYNEPISFMEKGIAFFVFPNGEFDFNTHPEDSQGDYVYKTSERRNRAVVDRRQKYGMLIEHDRFGRVRRIGNTFINYDFENRVNRIGTVYMRYNRFALTQIGGMRIVYNCKGEIIDTIGDVKGLGHCGYVYNYYDDNQESHYTANNNSNNAYYYYRTDGSKARIDDDKNKR